MRKEKKLLLTAACLFGLATFGLAITASMYSKYGAARA